MAPARTLMLASGALSLLTAGYGEVDRRFLGGPLDRLMAPVPDLLFHGLAIGLVALGFVLMLFAPESRPARRDVKLQPRGRTVDPAREEAARARAADASHTGDVANMQAHYGAPSTNGASPAAGPAASSIRPSRSPAPAAAARGGSGARGAAAPDPPDPNQGAGPPVDAAPPGPRQEPSALKIGRREPSVVDPALRGHPNEVPAHAQAPAPAPAAVEDPLETRLQELGQRADRLKVEYALGRISAGGYKELQSRIEKEQANIEAAIADREIA